ncbi:MAG: sulfotransferase domain-containing protein, partial [Phycisphaerales bacterium]|nr:sulfotransferase domain-containing protein [Phycisphaerales bacterium]
RMEDPVHIVRYEDLHEDLEGTRRAMYTFLGADPDEADPVSDETMTSAGLQREDPMSHNRKGAVGDWTRYFHDDMRAWYKDEAGDALIEAGYVESHGW